MLKWKWKRKIGDPGITVRKVFQVAVDGAHRFGRWWHSRLISRRWDGNGNSAARHDTISTVQADMMHLNQIVGDRFHRFAVPEIVRAGQENDHIRMALFYGVLQSRSIVVQIVQHHLRRPTGHATVSHGGIFALQCLFQEGCVREQLIVSRHSGRQRIPKREHAARRELAVFGICTTSAGST